MLVVAVVFFDTIELLIHLEDEFQAHPTQMYSGVALVKFSIYDYAELQKYIPSVSAL